MRILAAIPHYHRPKKDARHGSMSQDPAKRARTLRRAILSIHRACGARAGIIQPVDRTSHPANQQLANAVTVAVCTTGDNHLLGSLSLPGSLCTHVRTDAPPELLGLACRKLLAQKLGEYDLFCYLEDDLCIHDPLFFVKAAWFSRHTGNLALLMPNRYEHALKGPFAKVYVDGDLRPEITEKWQNRQEQPLIRARVMDWDLAFIRPANPHAGCYFLNKAQMEHWAAQDHFLDPAPDFIGPLESAATLGVMRTFRIYKPHPACAAFFEIEHAGAAFASLIGKTVAPPRPAKKD